MEWTANDSNDTQNWIINWFSEIHIKVIGINVARALIIWLQLMLLSIWRWDFKSRQVSLQSNFDDT